MSENSIIRANGQGLQLSTLAEYREFAQIVVKSGWAPRSLDTPEKVILCVQMGAEVGLSPTQALQSIAIVNGTATIYGDTALGLVRRSGLLEWIKEDIEGSFSTNLEKVEGAVRAVCTVKRAGDPEPVQRSFCVAEAKLAGLWGKAGPWRTHPQRMLKYKARAFALRDVFPDVLKGLHVNEEMHGERIAVSSSDVTVSSQTLLLEGDDSGLRTEEQRDQPVPERQEARGQAGPELHGPRDRDGRAGVGETVGQQKQGRQQDHPEDTAGAEATEPERTAGDTGADGGNQVLSEDLFDDDAAKKYVCDKCGTLYMVKPARGACVAEDNDGFACGGKVVERARQTT